MENGIDIRTLGNFNTPVEDSNLGVYVVFKMETVKNEAKSRELNRPVCEEVLFIEKHLPGGRDIVSKPATEAEKEQYPRAYAFFKKQNKSPDDVAGTPLTELSFLGRARVMEYRLMNVHTVEQLSALSDASMQSMGPGAREESAKARAYLKAASDGAIVQKQEDEKLELKRILDSMREENAELKKAVFALEGKITSSDESVEKSQKKSKRTYAESGGTNSPGDA